MEINQALNQAAAETETSAKATGEETVPAIEGNEGSTQAQQGNELGVVVPPEIKAAVEAKEKELLRAFHEKTQEMAREREELGRYKEDAQALYRLADQEWFKQSAEAEKRRRAGAPVELSAEAFENLTRDPKAFADYLAKRDQAVSQTLRQEFEVKLKELGQSHQDLVATRDLEAAASKYGEDFTSAKEDGTLQPYLVKYDPETAFKLYQADRGKVAQPLSQRRKEQPVADKKAAAVDKGGMSSVRGGPVYKPKTSDEAIDLAFELAAKGIKDYRFERS